MITNYFQFMQEMMTTNKLVVTKPINIVLFKNLIMQKLFLHTPLVLKIPVFTNYMVHQVLVFQVIPGLILKKVRLMRSMDSIIFQKI